MTKPNNIDSILTMVENPVRRKIIKRLSQEPSYPLELSKELGMGQQLVAAHLGIMERKGLLGSSTQTSPVGPSRKIYFLKKSVYLSVGFGPHLYSEQILSFDTLPSEISEEAEEFISRIRSIQKSSQQARMSTLSDLISEIDLQLDNVEAEKAVLLYVRNLAMKQAVEAMDRTDKTHEERRVLHFILDERSQEVESIAAALNLRESVIREILQSLKKELPEV
jgi:ArsR family transcriptional regulator